MTTAGDNRLRMPLTLRLDPWTPTYESAVQLDDDEPGAPADVAPFVETEDWKPMLPQFVDRPRTIAFVDGVQRIEMRVIGDSDGKMIYGAFASVAVGAVFVREGECTVSGEMPMRVLALSDGESYAPTTIACGTAPLKFRSQTTGESGINAVQRAIQDARSKEEIRLGEILDQQGHDMVVVDGRLNWQPKSGSMVIGLIKTMHKQYLSQPQLSVLAELAPGERTPIFRIEGKHAVYSWYIRLAKSRPMDHHLGGLVRLETLDSVPFDAAKRLADLTACHLPAFASSSMHDARAPQNLYPIGGLETQLRHTLGDHDWIRRHIEMHFAREEALL
jgi:hypothetical protein